MEAFDYAMGLVSIVVGIAISDLAISFHKLFRHRRTLCWDARTLLTAALTFVVLFSMWFELWAVHGRPEILNYPFLLSIVVELVLLFLMATAVLPTIHFRTTISPHSTTTMRGRFGRSFCSFKSATLVTGSISN